MLPALPAELVQVHRLGCGLHAGAPRHGAAHGAEASMPKAAQGGRAWACGSGGAPPKRKTPAREQVLARSPTAWSARKPKPRAKRASSPSVVDGLARRGSARGRGDSARAGRARARSELRAADADGGAGAGGERAARRGGGADFSVHLIDGVTGSGKTEVYFEAVAEAIRRGTPGADPASGDRADRALPRSLRRALRRAAGRMAFAGAAAQARRAAVGCGRAGEARWSPVRARRCFCRSSDLGLIVVDEEHDPAYKQEDGVHYHARDMAVVRGSLAEAPVVLASATPSHRKRGQRAARPLPASGAARALRRQLRSRRSKPLICAGGAAARPLGLRRASKPQSTRRSTAASRRCSSSTGAATRRSPSAAPAATACAARTATRGWSSTAIRKRLVCHHCGFAVPPPQPARNARRRIPLSPAAPASSACRRKCRRCFPKRARWCCRAISLAALIACAPNSKRSTKGEIDVIIGTQLVAKGHHFPGLALVGRGRRRSRPRPRRSARGGAHVPAAASGGRPRRARRRGPRPAADLPARASGDGGAHRSATARRSMSREIEEREQAALPAVRAARRNRSSPPTTGPAAEGHARALAARAPQADGVRILGPAEAPLAMIRGRHRWRLLARSPRNFDLSALSARVARAGAGSRRAGCG